MSNALTIEPQFFILLMTLFLWFISLVYHSVKKKSKTRDGNIVILWKCAEWVMGLYALIYSISVVIFKAFGFQINIPMNDTSFTLLLIVGSYYILHGKIKKIFPN